MIVGMAFAGMCAVLSIALYGFPFDKNMDVFMLYVIGISIRLFCGIGIIMGLATLANMIFPPHMTTLQTILSGGMIIACGVLAFVLSCPLTLGIFQKKEY